MLNCTVAQTAMKDGNCLTSSASAGQGKQDAATEVIASGQEAGGSETLLFRRVELLAGLPKRCGDGTLCQIVKGREGGRSLLRCLEGGTVHLHPERNVRLAAGKRSAGCCLSFASVWEV